MTSCMTLSKTVFGDRSAPRGNQKIAYVTSSAFQLVPGPSYLRELEQGSQQQDDAAVFLSGCSECNSKEHVSSEGEIATEASG